MMRVKRIFDILLASAAAIVLLPLILIVFLLVKITSRGPALYWSKRVGVNNKLFNMPKFRSMRVDTPALATHIMNQQENSDQYLTPIGSFIRKSSLDEIPQLWSVLTGDMSMVGPRPALFNQDDLMQLRVDAGVHLLRPGITGWAQVNGRDEIPIPQKVGFDVHYLKHHTMILDCYIIFLTVMKVLRRDDVSH